jgi:hypothetical protein
MASDAEDAKTASEEAGKWLEQYAIAKGIDLDALSPAEWFIIAMQVPCAIRCWRVGLSIDVPPNEPCPECGKVYVYTKWDRLVGPDPF